MNAVSVVTHGSTTKRRVVGSLLALLGVLTLGLGLQFLLLRPAMLPEDVRFAGVAAEQLPPRLVEWLGLVFRTWGGFVAAFGILLVGLSGYLFTTRTSFIYGATAIGILIAFGRFLLSNIVIRSDYLVFIGILFGLAVIAAGGLVSAFHGDGRPDKSGGMGREQE